MFPPLQQPSISSDEMRTRVIRDTIVDKAWRSPDAEPRITTKLYPRDYAARIGFTEMFPGGNFVLLTLEDGAIDIRLVADDTHLDKTKGPLGPSLPCVASGLQLRLIETTLDPSSESDGYIFVEVRHDNVNLNHETCVQRTFTLLCLSNSSSFKTYPVLQISSRKYKR